MTSFDPIAYLNEPRWRSVSLGLDRIEQLLERLGNPQDSLRFVHVAGTNGKGSTSAFIAQILQEAGFKVGLFTSPYLIKFEERIQVNREVISFEDLLSVVLRVKDVAETMSDHPTEFELMTATAFLYFAEQKCDIVVAEVGLGGRLDSTNVISTAEVSLITPIALDHCAILGNTLAEIAQEKAGIIKQGVPVVSAPQAEDAREVIARTAHDKKSSLVFADALILGDNDNFSYKNYKNLHISLLGSYQKTNAVVALEGALCLRQSGWNISDEAIYQGLAHTKWAGRFELLAKNPPIVVDGSHNEQGIISLIETLDLRYPQRAVVFVVGILEDKAHEAMISHLVSYGKTFVAVPVSNPRSLSVSHLVQEIESIAQHQAKQIELFRATTIKEGIDKAVALAGNDGVVCACGSLYSIADIKKAVEDLNIK